MGLKRAEVVFPYDAEQEDELSLTVGDIITIIDMQDEGWWHGELNGKQGVFPENFVKLLEDRAPPTGTVVSSKPRATVTFDYDATMPDELDLKMGDVIEILNQEEEGWWEGRYNGKVGMFPSNFVELIEDSKPLVEIEESAPKEEAAKVEALTPKVDLPPKEVIVEKEPQQEKPSVPADKDAETKKPKPGMGFGFISNADLKKRLRPVSGTPEEPKVATKTEEANKPTQRVPPLGQADIPNSKKTEAVANAGMTKRNAPAPPPSQVKPELPPSAPEERYVAKFSYEPENEDEIALNVGDVVVVVNKEVCEGWWEGTVGGKTGVFPNNFVELAPMPAVPEIKPKEKDKPVGKKPLIPQGIKMPVLPVKKPESKDPPKTDNRPTLPETKKPTPLETYQSAAQDVETSLPPDPRADLKTLSLKRSPLQPSENPMPPGPKKTEARKVDSTKPEINKPDLKKPDLKKPPPPVTKTKPVPPKPAANKPVMKPPEGQESNQVKNAINNALSDRVRLPSISRKLPSQPPSLPTRAARESTTQPAKEPQKPEKQKPEPEKPKENKTEEISLDLDSVSSNKFLQNVTKTRAKIPGKSLPGKYAHNKDHAMEEDKSPATTKEITEKTEPKPPTSEQPASFPAVSNEAVESLKKDLSAVHSKMADMEKKLMKYIKVLTDDLDSEKKERATLQIEIDRLKKKVQILEGL